MLADGNTYTTTLSLNQEFNKSSEDYIRVYQKYISGLRGNACPMYPSCSNYTLQYINKYGLISGLVNGSDRMLRCGHERRLYGTTLQENGIKMLDLVEKSEEPKYLYKSPKTYYPFNQFYSDSILNFIGNLIKSNLFSEALLEINRQKIKNPSLASEYLAYEILCFNALSMHERAILTFELSRDSSKFNNSNIAKQLALSYYSIGNFKKVVEVDSAFSKSVSLFDWNMRVCQNLAFISMLKDGRLIKAGEYLMVNTYPDSNLAKLTLEQYKSIKYKSPATAAFLSTILPGAGYFYSGSKATGISALIFNGLVGYAAYSSFKSKNYGVGILTSILGVGFYIGNIQGSKKSAIRHNDFLKSKHFALFVEKTKLNLYN
jgi:putative component of membrane protein insertase Oxa1/YidC/SpoIIIJ protein YidD/TM2 domain-containing membrane protein YozV